MNRSLVHHEPHVLPATEDESWCEKNTGVGILSVFPVRSPPGTILFRPSALSRFLPLLHHFQRGNTAETVLPRHRRGYPRWNDIAALNQLEF